MAFNNVPINGWPQLKNLGTGEGTTDYADLENKPQINSVTLSGNKSLTDIGAAAAADVSDIQDLIPSDASTTNLLATADNIPGVATTSVPGIVQPDGTTITIADGVISAVGGSGSGESYSTTETQIGTWIDGSPIYRKVVDIGALPNNTQKYVNAGINTNIRIINLWGMSYTAGGSQIMLPYVSDSLTYMIAIQYNSISAAANPDSIYVTTHYDYTSFSTTYAVIEYIKIS